jgi:phosphoglycerate dehydrogenase-like enzyme
MQIYFHNRSADAAAPLTRADWDRHAHCLQVAPAPLFGTDAAQFRIHAPAVEVLVTSPMGVRELLPLDAPHLKLLFVTWAGLDRLAPYDWIPPGVTLLNNSGAHALKAAEYVVMGMLMMKNNMPALARAQAARQWVAGVGRTLAGGHVVIIGLGAIGGATATLARKLGMRVTGIRSAPRPHPDCEAVCGIDALDEVLPLADFVALALPHSPSTNLLLDRRHLSLLPTHAGVVNVGRGRTIDEGALCDLLDAGRLGGAVLDVFDQEPLPAAHRAWSTRNLVVTPHMSADDPDTVNDATIDILVRNLAAWRRGDALPNEFDPVRGTRTRS